MAIKYVRESDVQEVRDGKATPWTRMGPASRPLSRRQRTFMLVFGVAVVAILIQIALNLNRSADYVFQRVHRGTGTVIARGDHTPSAPGEAGSGTVTIEVVVGGTQRFTASHTIPDPYWESLAVGSRVAVLYQVNKLGREMRIVECGVVALPEEIR
jgi:hypothetical protein